MNLPPRHGGNLRWAATLAGCDAAEILDFSASINPLGMPDSVRVALQNSLDRIQHYPDPDSLRLRQALSHIHHLDPDWLLVGNGAAELLTWAARDLEPFQPVGLLTPAFGDYYRALEAFGVASYPIPWQRWQPPKLSLSSLCPPGLSGLILNNPHNPTGQVWQQSDLLALLRERAWGLVVVDEAFMDFCPPDASQSLIPWVQEFPNLVVLRSLTKFYALPGLRIGYAVGHPSRLTQWQRWRDPWTVNSLALIAAEVALEDQLFQAQTWAWLPDARESLYQGLKLIPGLVPYPSAANFILVHYSGAVLTLQTQLLEKARILIRDCLSFPELGNGYFRVAVRTHAENQQLLTALARIIQ
ncbi:threonine-phosphate decarboxylase CobD [Thermosynechococcaceae cyanobacterium BACA0444]|uniref:threonine-phosphate decarboxylase n=1 Tax=Pseudocalidococcus azoricus BACA0444 TaxID=2918990 RepID=A0AAE4FUV8_9CYAN|nr:threonine-phosphate decarboxylase CobD [Pseudocalidococcus azoricus]MDS3861737.1 threonine-phosphate decarboxylase CobD [Pseudocalidococcus azoricus BACA0444]